jgi:hypothetical protein
MDRDEALAARRHGRLTEALVMPADDANGWVLILVEERGGHRVFTDHTGTEKLYHDLDQATAVARELGFGSVRVEEPF